MFFDIFSFFHVCDFFFSERGPGVLYRHGSWQRSKRKKDFLEAQKEKRKAHFATLMDICHLRNDELELKAPKIHRSSRAPRRHSRRWLWIVRNVYWTRIISISNDSRKRYTQVKMDDAPLKKKRMSRCMDTSSKAHKWPKSWSSMEDLVVPLERNLYGHPLARLLWERQSEKVKLKHCREKFQIGKVCLPTQTGKQDRKHRTDLENSHERRWSGRTNIISWPRVFGLHSKRV